MIYLSASSIKDFLSCERKYWYRRFASDRAETSEAATRGTAVHKAIEKYWNNSSKGYRYLHALPNDIDTVKATQALDTFYNRFQHLLNKNDLIENKFQINYSKGVRIIGVFDRVSENGVIYDWKTNKRLPKDLDNDPQFILYHHAYSVLNQRFPASIYFASLTYGRLVKFKYNNIKRDILLHQIIPDMLEHIKEKKFNPTGLYGYTTCNYCFYKEHCHSTLGLEEQDGLDHKEFNFR